MGDLRIERVYMIVIMVAWFTAAEKQLTENKVNFAIALFAIAMTVSVIMSPYTNPMDSVIYQTWMKYVVFYVLVMTSVRTERDLKLLVVAFVVVFFIYMLHSYREYNNGRYDWAMGTRRMIGVDVTMSNPNGFGNSIVIMLPMILPVMGLIKKKWMFLFPIAYFLLSARCVQLTGSRSSLMILGLCVIIGAVLSKKRMTYLPLLALGAVVMWATMTDNLRDRYRSIFDSSVNESANESALGRLHGFLEGLENWEESPIWGVGPDCHGYAQGTGFLSHCLYGQIPGELGTLGVVAFLMLLGCYFMNHFTIWSDCKYLQRYGLESEGRFYLMVSQGIVASVIMMLFFGIAGHNGYRYTWVWLAAFQAVSCLLLHQKVDTVRKMNLAGIPITLENFQRQLERQDPSGKKKLEQIKKPAF